MEETLEKHHRHRNHSHNHAHSPRWIPPGPCPSRTIDRTRPIPDLKRGEILPAISSVERPIPTIPRKAIIACRRHGSPTPPEATTKHSASDADGPLRVESAVSLGSGVEAVADDGVAFVIGVGGVKGRDVAVGGVRSVGDVY